MDQKRRREIDNINNDIRSTEHYNKVDEETISRLESENVKANSGRIQKLKEKIEERLTSLEELLSKREKIERGELDEEIASSFNIAVQGKRKTGAQKGFLNLLDEDDLVKEKREKKAFVFDNSRINFKKEYAYYMSQVEKLPDHLQKKINNSPNNLGWLWHGIVFYGALPPEYNRPDIIFDKQGNTLFITEIFPWEKIVWKKEGEKQKVLVSRKKRKNRWKF